MGRDWLRDSGDSELWHAGYSLTLTYQRLAHVCTITLDGLSAGPHVCTFVQPLWHEEYTQVSMFTHMSYKCSIESKQDNIM